MLHKLLYEILIVIISFYYLHRGCTWEEATRILAQNEENSHTTSSISSHPTTHNKRKNRTVSGFYVTRNVSQGKHFVALILDKGSRHNVVIVRPTTGRNEMNLTVSACCLFFCLLLMFGFDAKLLLVGTVSIFRLKNFSHIAVITNFYNYLTTYHLSL